MKKGFTLIELLIVVAIIAILAAIAIPNFLQAQTRAKVSRAESDMRSIATAIESYYIDHNMYPAFGIEQEYTIAEFEDDGVEYATFVAYNPDDDEMRAHGITTPTAYMTSVPSDEFGPGGETAPMRYAALFTGRTIHPEIDATAPGTGWILASFGPNTNFPVGDIVLLEDETGPDDDGAGWGNLNMDQDPPDLAFTYTATHWDDRASHEGDTIRSVAAASYDPTNGTVSPGDIWRARQ